MYKEVLRSVEGIGIYPVISLIIFLIVFTAVVYWFLKVDKKYLREMANIPLENDDVLNSNNSGNEK
ncbi:MAG TPA: hypothetical protein VLN45_04755 [Ignavibacteriaceae bacterium]|nr:hypothetical protein [Ignavibacteriaceae bacterium]